MFPVALLLILTGVLLYLAGRRGWLMGSHPYCRGCHFDLYRLPVERRRCPECGEDILAEGAIQIGRHRPMGSVIAAGLVLIVVGLGIGAVGFVPWWTRFDGSPYKTLSWLHADATASDDGLRNRTCAELMRRIRAGRITLEEGNHLADTLLRLQADTSVKWQRAWGDVVQAARKAGRISPDHWERYLQQAMQLSVRVRPRVTDGDPVPLGLTCRLRAGSDWEALSPAVLQPEMKITLGNLNAPVRFSSAKIESTPAPLEWSAFWSPSADQPALAPSSHRLTVDLTMLMKDWRGIVASRQWNLELPVEILPRGTSSVELRADPALRAEVEDSVRLSFPGGPADAQVAVGRETDSLGMAVISGPPAALSFRVVLRQGTREWPLALVMVRPNEAQRVPLNVKFSALAEPPVGGPAEVVFLPDPSLATGMADVLEVWSEPVVRRITLSVIER